MTLLEAEFVDAVMAEGEWLPPESDGDDPRCIFRRYQIGFGSVGALSVVKLEPYAIAVPDSGELFREACRRSEVEHERRKEIALRQILARE